MSKQSEQSKNSKDAQLQRNVLRTAKGGGFLASGTFFAYGSRFVIAFFLARLLGVDQYGVYNLAISSATIIASMAALGLDSTMVRYVAIHSKSRDEEGVWGTIQIGVGVSMVMSVLLSTALFFASDFVATSIFHAPQLGSFLRLFSFFIPFTTLSSVLVDVAYGFKRMDYSVIADKFVLFVARLIVIGILSLFGLDAYKAIVAFGLSDLAVSIALIYLLNKEFSFRRPFKQAKRNYREVITFALPFWAAGMLTKFRKNLQTLLLGSLNTITSVGIFTIVSRVNTISYTVTSSLVTSVKPVLAELQDKNNWVEVEHLYKTTTRWIVMCNLPVFLTILLYPAQLLAVFGAGFAAGATALIVLACGELVNASTGICGSIIDMTGQTKLKLINSVTWFISIVGLNVLLIPRWGVMGTAVATFVSISIVNILRALEVWFLYHIHPYNLTFAKPLVAALSTFGLMTLLNRWFSPGMNPIYVIIHIALLFVLYGGILFLMGFSPEERVIITRMYKRTISLLNNSRELLSARFSTTRLSKKNL